MKALLLLCLATLAGSSVVLADQVLGYPKKSPVLFFSVPDDWKGQIKHGSLYVLPPDGDSVIVEVSAMEAALDDLPGAIKEAKQTVSDFKKLHFTKGAGTEGDNLKDGLKITVFNGQGEDNHGPAVINLVILGDPKEGKNFLISVISSPDGFTKNGAAIRGIVDTVAAAGMPKAVAADLQTFSYPDKKNPEFSVDFPATWKLSPNDEGAYIESPDQLIAMNLLMIDISDLNVARETMKKKVGAGYQSIEWNSGAKPEVNKDDALGLTAIFDNAVAMDGDVKYSVNFVQYVRKGSDKFLLLFSQQPLKALDKHGDEMTKIIQSIKVKNP